MPRDHKAAHRRRDERARAEGYASAYDKRVRTAYARERGVRPSPRAKLPPTPAERARAAGHLRDYRERETRRNLARIVKETDPGSLVSLRWRSENLQREPDGAWRQVPLVIVSLDGDEQEWDLYDVDDADLDWLIAELDELEVDFTVGPYSPSALIAYR